MKTQHRYEEINYPTVGQFPYSPALVAQTLLAFGKEVEIGRLSLMLPPQ